MKIWKGVHMQISNSIGILGLKTEARTTAIELAHDILYSCQTIYVYIHVVAL